MTVAELIVELQKCDPETIVVMPRGDGYYAALGLAEFEDLVYADALSDVYDTTDRENAPGDSVPCCMLSPED